MGGLEHGRMGQAHICGQHGYPNGDSTHIQPGFTPNSLYLEPVLDGGLRHNTVNNDDCVTEGTCRSFRPSPPMRRPSRQAMDKPYSTMVSFTKEVNITTRNMFLLT
jgi:hypothetical protein